MEINQPYMTKKGWYDTILPWKANHPELPNNKEGSLGRLNSLVKRLQNDPYLFEKYDEIIKDQLAEGIVEKAPIEANGKEFYIPHKPVLRESAGSTKVRESAGSTKVRVVYDTSARAYGQAPSLNECLENGPPPQNQLWDILVRNRFNPITLYGDLKQAFLRVRINECDRDTLRFYWIINKDTKQVQTLRFARALFGLGPSPFLLGGTIAQHMENSRDEYPEEVEKISHYLYVDDPITGDTNVEKVKHLKETATDIFQNADFELHKVKPSDESDQSFSKQQLGVGNDETKLLGLQWNKAEDTITVTFPKCKEKPTKQIVLRMMAQVYDPLGMVAPVTLVSKEIYHEICDRKLSWDEELPPDLKKRWRKWRTT